MIFQVNLGQVLSYDVNATQGIVNFMFFIFIGLIALIILGYILSRIYKNMTYKYVVDIYKKVGDTHIQLRDKAKQVKLEGSYMYHYAKLNKYSPIVDPKFHRIVEIPSFIMPRKAVGFSIFLHGESIFPIAVKDNPGLEPINMDLFNYLQMRVQANKKKYERINQLYQLLPYIAVGGVIIMFIVGMIFYTKHIENVSAQILGVAKEASTNIIQNSGAGQVIQPA